MTEDLMDLARRAVAVVEISKWPDWTPVTSGIGMGTLRRGRVLELTASVTYPPDENCIPLLDTPAGLGSLESVARQRNSGNLAVYIGNGWFSVETDSRDMDDDNCESLAHALVRAMESAP